MLGKDMLKDHFIIDSIIEENMLRKGKGNTDDDHHHWGFEYCAVPSEK